MLFNKLQYHPDKLQQNGITSQEIIEKNKRKFQEIQKAWDNISTPEKKLQYDKELLGIYYFNNNNYIYIL